MWRHGPRQRGWSRQTRDLSYVLVGCYTFLGDRLQNGSTNAIGPLSVCPVLSICLSVTLVHCGQTVGRIKMKLGTQVGGLGPGHIMLAQLSPLKGSQPPIFGPYLLRLNGCMDQDATWYGGKPRPRRLCARWGPSPLPKRGGPPLLNFRPIFIVAKRLDASRCRLVWT